MPESEACWGFCPECFDENYQIDIEDEVEELIERAERCMENYHDLPEGLACELVDELKAARAEIERLENVIAWFKQRKSPLGWWPPNATKTSTTDMAGGIC